MNNGFKRFFGYIVQLPKGTHRFMVALSIGLLFTYSNDLTAQEDLCSSPQKSISTLLDNLQSNNWDTAKAAACLNGNKKTALQLKQI